MASSLHFLQVTLEKSVLVQESSQYELQGEYVLRGQRAGEKERDEEVMWERAMAGQLGTFITSMGRWRLHLEVPHAEVSEMLPVARILSRSSDPAIVSRSKVSSSSKNLSFSFLFNASSHHLFLIFYLS